MKNNGNWKHKCTYTYIHTNILAIYTSGIYKLLLGLYTDYTRVSRLGFGD